MSSVRVYEPGADSSTRAIDTETQPDGSERQVVKTIAPDTHSMGVITVKDGSANLVYPQEGSFLLHPEQDGDSAFSCSVKPPSSGNYTFVFERSINYGLVPAGEEVWTAVGAFQAGTPIIKSTWTQADANRALEFHGNMSATGALRIRFTNFPASGQAIVLIRSGRGTGTVTIGNPVGVRDATAHGQQLKVNANGSVDVNNLAPFQNVRQAAETAAREGRAFFSSSGQQATGSLGTTTLRGTLQNPSTSTKRLFVYALDVWSSSATGYGSLLINPTAGLPAAAKVVNNTYVGHSNPANGLVKFDAGAAMTGGSDSGVAIPAPSGVFNKIMLDAPVILSPGVIMAIQAPFGAATTVVVTLYWFEEA